MISAGFSSKMKQFLESDQFLCIFQSLIKFLFTLKAPWNTFITFLLLLLAAVVSVSSDSLKFASLWSGYRTFCWELDGVTAPPSPPAVRPSVAWAETGLWTPTEDHLVESFSFTGWFFSHSSKNDFTWEQIWDYYEADIPADVCCFTLWERKKESCSTFCDSQSFLKSSVMLHQIAANKSVGSDLLLHSVKFRVIHPKCQPMMRKSSPWV